jgi:hypothetical protein
VGQRANGSIQTRCLTCVSPPRLLYSFLLSWYGSFKPYKSLLRDTTQPTIFTSLLQYAPLPFCA